MRIARCRFEESEAWFSVDPEAGTARRVTGAFTKWAQRLTERPGSALRLSADNIPLEKLRFLPPALPTATVVATGATYAKHIAGLGLQMPKSPSAFMKTYPSLIGHEEQIAYPAITTQLDYECELVVVVGAAEIDRENPIRCVLGYTAGNDVSARDQQFSGGVTGMDMFSGKVLDGTSGLGPWIVTRDEFGDVHPDLELELTVDGERRQHDRTGSMVWGVGDLLNYVDARTRLHCGDVMFTGTPAGVAHEDGRYLEPGQVVEARVERIGTLRNVVGARPLENPALTEDRISVPS